MSQGVTTPPTPLVALSSAFFSGGAQNVGSPTLNFRCFFAIFLDFHRTNFFQILPDLSRLLILLALLFSLMLLPKQRLRRCSITHYRADEWNSLGGLCHVVRDSKGI